MGGGGWCGRCPGCLARVVSQELFAALAGWALLLGVRARSLLGAALSAVPFFAPRRLCS